MLYRLILVVYFLIYFVWAIVIGKGYFFIFATSFSFLLFIFYLLWSTVYVTARYFQQFAPFCEQSCEKQQKEENCDQIPLGCCDVKTDSTKWYEKIQWFLFTVGAESTLSITLIYWPFGDVQRDDNFEFYGHVNIALHLVNGVTALIDIWVSQIPVHLYHVIYLVGVTSLYAIFTGLYYVGGGGNDYDNGTYIYPQLDYGNSPGTASVFVIGVTIIYMPLVHLFVYINYLMREGLLYVIKKMCCKFHKNDIRESNGTIYQGNIIYNHN